MTGSDRTILVTGAGGFVGRALLTALKSTSPAASVVGVDRIERPAGSVDCDRWKLVDLSDGQAVRQLIASERPARIFHLAGLARGTDWGALYLANVATTIALLEAIRAEGEPCVVTIPGSAAEYGPVPADRLPIAETEMPRPVSPYGVSKVWQTIAARSFTAVGVDVRIARLFNMVAPAVPESFALGAFVAQLRSIAEGKRPPILSTGPLDSIRDFLDVRDVATGLIAVAEQGASGEIYNVCSGRGVSMRECLNLLIELSGLDVAVESASAPNGHAIDSSIGSRSKIGEMTGWRPSFELADSLAAMWTAR